MDKEVHLEFLRTKYIELSRQYLSQLQAGKTIDELKDLAEVIGTLVTEIEVLEKYSNEKSE